MPEMAKNDIRKYLLWEFGKKIEFRNITLFNSNAHN
jgi:hypothetical protein